MEEFIKETGFDRFNLLKSQVVHAKVLVDPSNLGEYINHAKYVGQQIMKQK